MNDTYIYLCCVKVNGVVEVKAIYLDDASAEAWQAGTNVGYERGANILINANAGEINLDKLWEDWWNSDDD